MNLKKWLPLTLATTGLALAAVAADPAPAAAPAAPTASPPMKNDQRLLHDIASRFNHDARRFIDAPVFHWPKAELPRELNLWRLVLEQDGVRHVIENDEPVLDTVSVWPKLRAGHWVQVRLLGYDRETGWCGLDSPVCHTVRGTKVSMFSKAPDWEDHEEQPLDFAASLRRNCAWFDSQEDNPGAYYREPGMPAWWWHAAESAYPAKGWKYQSSTYPNGAYIPALLAQARLFPERAERDRKTAVAIGDWLLRNRTPMTGAAPGLPYSSVSEGKFEHGVEGKAINLSFAPMTGQGMLALFKATGEQKYLDYAIHLANVLEKFVAADGSFPYRVKPDTGEVVEQYTTGHARLALFLEDLNAIAPDPRWPAAAMRILDWLVAHPMVDFNWKACYEDVTPERPFINLTQMDAQLAVRLFCRHVKERPELLPKARKLFRWIEDQFVNFGDEPSLSVRTYYPAVREQYVCDYPMGGHSANYAASCRALFQVTGEEVFRRKQVATLNAIVKSQRPDGAYSTWGMSREGLSGMGGNWFRCNHGAAAGLADFLLRARGEGDAGEWF
jgi:hypothetical protein